jgi:nucleotide-binding universal stress UspA family protein
MKTKPAKKPTSATATSGIVLCGTDFSSAADVAVDIATDFARRLDVPLSLLHAVEMPRVLEGDAKVTRWLMASRKRSLRELAAGSRKRGVEVVESVRTGNADELLVDTARTEKAQMIVVSSQGERGPGKWFLGRVAERTAENAETPVLVLRDARPLRAWLHGKRVLRIFVAYNFTKASNVALRWTKKLAGLGPCEITLGYVNHPIEDHVRIGARGPLPFEGNSPDVLSVLERDMKARARSMLGDIPVRCYIVPHDGGADLRLAKMAADEDADLIVAGSRQYAGFQRLWHASI